MQNDVSEKTQFAVVIETSRGTITIESADDDGGVGYHYKPIEKSDPYYNGPITVNPTGTTDHNQIEEALRRSWLEPSHSLVVRIENAACLVHSLAANTKYTEVPVMLSSEEYGNEQFGPYDNLNDALAATSRIYRKSADDDDGIERTIGPHINDPFGFDDE